MQYDSYVTRIPWGRFSWLVQRNVSKGHISLDGPAKLVTLGDGHIASGDFITEVMQIPNILYLSSFFGGFQNESVL